MWKRPRRTPLDWRAICNLDVARLRGPATAGRAEKRLQVRPGHLSALMSALELELWPEDTPALLQAALAATACGDLDAAASAPPPRSARLAGLAPEGAAVRLLDVAQAALQWGRWNMLMQRAAWQRTCAPADVAMREIESCSSAIARLEQAVADVRRATATNAGFRAVQHACCVMCMHAV